MEQVGPSTEGFQTVELHSPPAGATAASEENRGRESPPCYSTLFRKGSTETLDQFGKLDIIYEKYMYFV